MTKQFWIGDCYVDLTRNQIKFTEKVEQLQPKVLAVLQVLAEQQGSVVSHDELLDKVWGEVLVTPNTLQRCITQLRKVLGDDSKSQLIIKTHAKQGYSLEVPVVWDGSSLNRATQKSAWLPLTLGFFALFLLVFWLVQMDEENSQRRYSKIEALTANDLREFNASYSPDGQFLVFQRYNSHCENHIWAKNLKNHQEHRLTQHWGHYGEFSWSPDGSSLVFTQQTNCVDVPKPKEKPCWELMTLDVTKALTSPQAVESRLSCGRHEISSPQWIAEDSVTLIYGGEGLRQLANFQFSSGEFDKLMPEQGEQILSLAASRDKSELVVYVKDAQGDFFLKLINANDFSVVKRINLIPPEHIVLNERLWPKYHPGGEGFLVGIRGDLYFVNKEGLFEAIELPTYQSVYTPSFHPDGDKIIGTVGNIDTDIIRINGSEETPNAFNFDSLARSPVMESEGRWQPNGDSLTFISTRSGSAQLWLMENGTSRQISSLAKGVNIQGIQWASNGDGIYMVANHQLSLYSLDNQVRHFALNLVVDSFHQVMDDSTLLVGSIVGGDYRVHLVNLDTLELTELPLSQISSIQHISNDFFAYSDIHQNVFLWNSASPQSEAEQVQGLHGGRLLVHGDYLYGIDLEHQVWRYHLHSKGINVLSKTDRHTWSLTDYRDGQLLATRLLSARKEIVLLSQ